MVSMKVNDKVERDGKVAVILAMNLNYNLKDSTKTAEYRDPIATIQFLDNGSTRVSRVSKLRKIEDGGIDSDRPTIVAAVAKARENGKLLEGVDIAKALENEAAQYDAEMLQWAIEAIEELGESDLRILAKGDDVATHYINLAQTMKASE